MFDKGTIKNKKLIIFIRHPLKDERAQKISHATLPLKVPVWPDPSVCRIPQCSTRGSCKRTCRSAENKIKTHFTQCLIIAK